MSKSPKPTPMAGAEQAGAIDAFAAWRQSKQFEVGGLLQSREDLKANALRLRRQILGEGGQ